MAEDENRDKWEEFVEIGNTIQKMRGEFRILEAIRAVETAKLLLRNGFFVNLPTKDRQLYKTLLPKIAVYLDGNTEMIQTAVDRYFLARHCKAGLDEKNFNITFSTKNSGIQTGFTCDVDDGNQTTRFYIKTHQYGPTDDNPKSREPPDAKELFIYQILHRIGIGPEVHFIVPRHGTNMTIYIATKDCGLTLLSKLTRETANTKALVQLDLISRILCLRDCATNSSNCGQVKDKPMIVDFRIDNQRGYVKPDLLEKFYQGNGEFNYLGWMREAVGIPQEEKLRILKESVQAWNLLENIDIAMSEIEKLIQEIAATLRVNSDLDQYIRDIKETIKILSQV